ncbi:MAG: tRNA (guanosine(46)-N7)-methyltransferase TrmB [Kiritimatiellae bacterium]|nr:tRNA (guanosine(46)-N7)-methyltransferase TrmB [Kiritimatiellia bacterium]
MNEILPHVIELKADEPTLDIPALAPGMPPIELEIGCGNGRFIAARATKNPEQPYLAVERMMERLRRCSRKAQHGELQNLTFVRVEAGRFVREVLPDHCVKAMYLFFPDPWPKRRHHKNRFFQREMCDTLTRIFVPGGIMYISTDHEDYFKEMYRFLSEDNRFEEIAPLIREADEQTDFERLFLSKGDPIYHCAFRLRD